MRPETRALLDAQVELIRLLGPEPLPSQERASPAIVAAVERITLALVAWLVVGGPDRDDPTHGPALARAWKLRHEANVRRVVALARSRGPASATMAQRAHTGAPPWVTAQLDQLPESARATLGATEARIATSGVLGELQQALVGLDPSKLDPMAFAVGGFTRGAPGWEQRVLELAQIAHNTDLEVMAKMWSWMGVILRLVLEEPGPVWSAVSAKSTGSASLRLFSASDEVALINVFFPALVPGPGPLIAEALCRVLAVALDAPPMEVA